MIMRKTRVFYDHRVFAQRYGGISRYFIELTKAKDFTSVLSVIFSQNEYYKLNNNENVFTYDYGKLVNRLLRSINFFYALIISIIGNYDIYHPTYYKYDLITRLNRRPIIVTVVDMIHEKFPYYFADSRRLIQDKKKLILLSSKVIAISETTKKDILEFYNIEPSKIEVIYLASKLQKFINLDLKLPSNYILFVGNRGYYKNFQTLVKSFKLIVDKYSDIFLLCVGGGKFSDSEELLLNSFLVRDKVIQFDSNEADLFTYYSKALVFVFPSFYEGFGIPILEAFESNCPVACSNSDCFREIAGNAAVYFNAEDHKSIVKKVFMIIESETVRDKLTFLGGKRTQKFMWSKTIEYTNNIYKGVLNKNNGD